ncbi:metal ABC transporter solute-binding protein, Zn/Mn family [Microbacterium sulfonylureivorans]|uniref:metal ABC transporter solute-binding protein, Zn/Mn family n=1 Tax=Microbacterium sulfonylureivorans TaxID=2486854 RepID=UPI000FD9A8DC|nr:zinc ABC transporter substrate-binding protein [Microbacterium sulfonylureivorans]
MTSARRSTTFLGLAAASTLALAGCAGGTAADQGGGDVISVVASTNVYGQIAEAIGGDLVEVTSIVSNESQDPHSFEASARDQLTVADADLIIENGGGYDAFIDALIDSSGSQAPVVTAVEHSHDWPENDGHAEESDDEDDTAGEAAEADDAADSESDDHDHADHEHVEGFNEHVWYDPHTVAHLAEEIAEELAELSPENAAAFTANADAFVAEVEQLEASLAEIDANHAGAQVFLTEPVPAYLVAAAGLVNVTPDAFSEAVEEGQDVAPATLLESIALFEDDQVSVVITNAQTAGAETAQIVGEADGRGIPSIAFSETVPEGQTYISWMQANIEALNGALTE